MENKKIEIDLETYEKLITENVSLKKEIEFKQKESETVTLTLNSHTNNTEKTENKPKKGIF